MMKVHGEKAPVILITNHHPINLEGRVLLGSRPCGAMLRPSNHPKGVCMNPRAQRPQKICGLRLQLVQPRRAVRTYELDALIKIGNKIPPVT